MCVRKASEDLEPHKLKNHAENVLVTKLQKSQLYKSLLTKE